METSLEDWADVFAATVASPQRAEMRTLALEVLRTVTSDTAEDTLLEVRRVLRRTVLEAVARKEDPRAVLRARDLVQRMSSPAHVAG